MRIITIQPEQFTDNVWVNKEGKIVEGKKLPYPFHVEADTGLVTRQDFWNGDPYAIVGFQNKDDVQQVDLWWDDAARNPDSIVGKFAVMTKRGGGLYTYTLAIESVTVTEMGSVL